MTRAGGDPAAELCHKALEHGLVWVEVILHLQGEGVGGELRQDLELPRSETGLEDGEGEDGRGVMQHGLHGSWPQSLQLRQVCPCPHRDGVDQ